MQSVKQQCFKCQATFLLGLKSFASPDRESNASLPLQCCMLLFTRPEMLT